MIVIGAWHLRRSRLDWMVILSDYSAIDKCAPSACLPEHLPPPRRSLDPDVGDFVVCFMRFYFVSLCKRQFAARLQKPVSRSHVCACSQNWKIAKLTSAENGTGDSDVHIPRHHFLIIVPAHKKVDQHKNSARASPITPRPYPTTAVLQCYVCCCVFTISLTAFVAYHGPIACAHWLVHIYFYGRLYLCPLLAPFWSTKCFAVLCWAGAVAQKYRERM